MNYNKHIALILAIIKLSLANPNEDFHPVALLENEKLDEIHIKNKTITVACIDSAFIKKYAQTYVAAESIDGSKCTYTADKLTTIRSNPFVVTSIDDSSFRIKMTRGFDTIRLPIKNISFVQRYIDHDSMLFFSTEGGDPQATFLKNTGLLVLYGIGAAALSVIFAYILIGNSGAFGG